MHLSKILLFVSASASIVGCTHNYELTKQEQLLESEKQVDIKIRDQIKQSVSRIEKLQHKIYELENTREPSLVNMIDDAPDIPEFNKKVNLIFYGELEPLVRKIAKIAGNRWHVKIINKKPSLPILIRINHNQIKLSEILRQAGAQSGRYNGIKINQSQRLIKIVYASSNH